MEINLSDYFNESISTRKTGIEFSKQIYLLNLLVSGISVKIIIGDKINAINNSFIKGLFTEVIDKYGLELIRSKVTIEGSDYFKKLFDRNWEVIDFICNEKM